MKNKKIYIDSLHLTFNSALLLDVNEDINAML